MELKRYLVRRGTSDVFVWTEALAKRSGLEEVWAKNAAEALTKEALPNPRELSLDQLERMTKTDLAVFAEVKLGMRLPPNETKDKLVDLVKERVFTLPPDPAMTVQQESRPFPNVSQIRASRTAGDVAKIEGTLLEGADANQHLRS